MNAIQKLAALLQDRKGIEARTGRNDPPAPAPPVPTNCRGPKAGYRRRARYSASKHEFVLLEARLRKATARAERAESQLKIHTERMGQRVKDLLAAVRTLRAELRAAKKGTAYGQRPHQQ